MLDLASVRLRVPMREGVSSLNLAVAAGIVLYSAK
jgi:tRNA G18 (ribose-2'-O)-methylase SpoU